MNQLPPPLKLGDTIGIVAPASSFDRDIFFKGVVKLSEMGFNPFIPEGLFDKEDYLAGPDAHRAQIFMNLIRDDAVKAVICARGGYGSLRMLPFLDFETIKHSPKPLIGFSDITALLCAMTENCGWVTFHGPMVQTLPETDPPSCDELKAVLLADYPLMVTPSSGVPLRPGITTGPVIGGNLTTLCHLIGTPYEPTWQGRILFIEDCGEALYRIDRMLTHLKLAGCLDNLAGLIIGDFEGIEIKTDIWRIVMSVVQTTSYPIAAGFPIGHSPQNVTIPMGMTATLDAGKPVLIFNGQPEAMDRNSQ